ncbi:MAG: DUF6765 family protein [Chlorobium sp.]
MQLDMHYYGTYAMARAAGLKKEVCEIIATASQFVDDNAEKTSVEFMDGARLDVEATAHHAINIKNLDREDQRQIWVPFHFLPGNEGDSYTQRLVCQKESDIAKEMVEFNLSLIDQPFALPLLGITAHVYADTFSHYGFSGVSSRRNKIKNDSINFYSLDPEIEKYITNKTDKFKEKYPKEDGLLDNIKSWFAEEASGALGHGAVMTYPDLPYLEWDFIYENSSNGVRCPVRNNQRTFFDCCSKLHEIFQRVAAKRDDFSDKAAFIDFSRIEQSVRKIISLQATKQERIDAWKNAAQSGLLFGTGNEEINDYDANSWLSKRDCLKGTKDSRVAPKLPVFRFYQAAAVHRINVIRHILPEKELVVA